MATPTARSAETDRGPLPFGPGLVVLLLGLLLAGVIAAGAWLNSREGTLGEPVVTIAAFRADPSRYDNQVVSIDGQAEDVRELPFLSQYALYTLRDETGSMRVLTQHGVPPAGAPTRLGVAGELVRLIPGIPLNVVFLEQERYEVTAGQGNTSRPIARLMVMPNN
ncbi:MAG TPA: hypothetical protein PKA95_03195 [Thermomicrobiales bacterium]|nr:hypothetical protein [Thermomicrobiales bacterium]